MLKDVSKKPDPTLERMLRTLAEKVNPSNAALIVVDMQNDFCANEGLLGKQDLNLKPIQAIVPNLINVINKAREVGLFIIYTLDISDNFYRSDVWHEQRIRTSNKMPPDMKEKFLAYEALEKGSWGADFYAGFKPLPGEAVIEKHRYSAFIDTELGLILRSKGIRTLIMSGVSSNCCVADTAHNGFGKDYYIVFLRDSTAARAEELHNSALKDIDLYYGEVVESTDVIKCWEQMEAGKGGKLSI